MKDFNVLFFTVYTDVWISGKNNRKNDSWLHIPSAKNLCDQQPLLPIFADKRKTILYNHGIITEDTQFGEGEVELEAESLPVSVEMCT